MLPLDQRGKKFSGPKIRHFVHIFWAGWQVWQPCLPYWPFRQHPTFQSSRLLHLIGYVYLQIFYLAKPYLKLLCFRKKCHEILEPCVWNIAITRATLRLMHYFLRRKCAISLNLPTLLADNLSWNFSLFSFSCSGSNANAFPCALSGYPIHAWHLLRSISKCRARIT